MECVTLVYFAITHSLRLSHSARWAKCYMATFSLSFRFSHVRYSVINSAQITSVKRVNFREKIWAFLRDKWNCPLYTGDGIKWVSVERVCTTTCCRKVQDQSTSIHNFSPLLINKRQLYFFSQLLFTAMIQHLFLLREKRKTKNSWTVGNVKSIERKAHIFKM